MEGFPRIVEGFPRSSEGFPLEVSVRPSDVSLGERSRRLLILGSTRDDCDGTTLPCVSIMVCPLEELDTSALSASPRRLTEGVLEVEGPTSADAGVASCLLLNAEPVFRRLRDDLLDGKIFDGMIRRGGNELPKGSVGNLSKNCGTSVAQAKREQSDSSNGKAGVDTIGTKAKHENFQTQKTFSNSHLTYRP